ncbi:ABC transporter ATP-binding protein [Alkalimarinus coralli]|uniref:ABC transporter ATP-binding protein n=1 Tax=Alkalimarinus coralli TaxID=2935863 RepID=UPI00202B6579|nr:ABC transporter ATP-binding protein [Alkalimarinus coralli]
MSIVETHDLTKTYQQNSIKVHALQDVTLNIDAGEFTVMVGPSGSGKTTLLNHIGALDTPTSGEIRIGGQLLSDLSCTALTKLRLWKLGFIFQEYNLISVLTALENVEYVMLLQGISGSERRKRAEAILHEVGLESMANRRPSELSGGQQQRVAVARAMVTQPSIILADEPTANLDSKTGASLLDLMRDLNEHHGTTFLFSTHDPMVMERAKRVIRLKDGRVDSEERR